MLVTELKKNQIYTQEQIIGGYKDTSKAQYKYYDKADDLYIFRRILNFGSYTIKFTKEEIEKELKNYN